MSQGEPILNLNLDYISDLTHLDFISLYSNNPLLDFVKIKMRIVLKKECITMQTKKAPLIDFYSWNQPPIQYVLSQS